MKKFLTIGQTNPLLISLVSGLLMLSFVCVPVTHTYAQAKDQVCVGLGGAAPGGGCQDTEDTVKDIVGAALNIVSIVIGIAGVLMIMIGGFRYISAGGDASKTSSAQGTIIWALVGLVVAALSQVIVRFVLDAV